MKSLILSRTIKVFSLMIIGFSSVMHAADFSVGAKFCQDESAQTTAEIENDVLEISTSNELISFKKKLDSKRCFETVYYASVELPGLVQDLFNRVLMPYDQKDLQCQDAVDSQKWNVSRVTTATPFDMRPYSLIGAGNGSAEQYLYIKDHPDCGGKTLVFRLRSKD